MASAQHKTPEVKSEPIPESQPDSILGIMVALTRFEKTREANEIMSQHEDDETRKEKLLELLKTAEKDLANKISRIAFKVSDRVNLKRLKRVLKICDVIKRRKALVELLENHGIDYRKVLS